MLRRAGAPLPAKPEPQQLGKVIFGGPVPYLPSMLSLQSVSAQ